VEEGVGARQAGAEPRAAAHASPGAVTLPENEHWWRAFADALPAAIYMTDTEGRITFYNQAAAQMWGYNSPARQERAVRLLEAVPAGRHAVAAR